MKPIAAVAGTVLSVVLLAAFGTAPAQAQNAAAIAHARDGASCPRCNLFQADFSNLRMSGRNFAGARLRQADFSASVMSHADFAGADLRDLNAYGGVFTGATFTGADMVNASFVGAYLEGANLRGANLAGANFSGAEMDHATGLTQRQLDQACGDPSTTLPRGLRIRACD